MATRSELRTRLQRRLGLGVLSAVEQERLNEAINSGLARALSDGVPGLSYSMFVGSPLGDLAVTAAAAVKSTTITISGGANLLTEEVMPHDILTFGTAGTQYLIKDVLTATTLSIGVPAVATISAEAATITRRSMMLPSTGQISAVVPVSGEGLCREPLVAHRDPFKTGTPRYYEQRYSEGQTASFISLWPAPSTANKQFTIRQAQFKTQLSSDSDTLGFPEEVLDAVLERARDCYLTWTGAANQNDITASFRAVRDTSDALKNSSNPKQIFYKT
jgi:hypothetical protein